MDKETAIHSKVILEFDGDNGTKIQMRNFKSSDSDESGRFYFCRKKDRTVSLKECTLSNSELKTLASNLYAYSRGEYSADSTDSREIKLVDTKDLAVTFLGISNDYSLHYDAYFEIENKMKTKNIRVRLDKATMNEFYTDSSTLVYELAPGKKALGCAGIEKKLMKRVRVKSILDMKLYEFQLSYSKWNKSDTSKAYDDIELGKQSVTPFEMAK